MIDRDLPLKKEIASNIKKLMKQKGWNQLKTSEMAGISKSTLSDYLNLKTLINPGNVEKLANAFQVSKDTIDPSFNIELVYKQVLTNKPFSYDTSAKTVSYNSPLNSTLLPIFGSISCGTGILCDENIEDYKEIPKTWIIGGEHFLLRAKGDSMINARIQDGDILLIRKQQTFENGEIMAVEIDNEALLKRVYRMNDNTILLQSENSKYPPKIFSEDSNIRIIGKLKMNFITY